MTSMKKQRIHQPNNLLIHRYDFFSKSSSSIIISMMIFFYRKKSTKIVFFIKSLSATTFPYQTSRQRFLFLLKGINDDFFHKLCHQWWLFLSKYPSTLNFFLQKNINNDFSYQKDYQRWQFLPEKQSLMTFLIKKRVLVDHPKLLVCKFSYIENYY